MNNPVCDYEEQTGSSSNHSNPPAADDVTLTPHSPLRIPHSIHSAIRNPQSAIFSSLTSTPMALRRSLI